MMTARRTMIAIGIFMLIALGVSVSLHYLVPESRSSSKTAVSFVAECTESSEKEVCLVRSFETYARSYGVKNALEAVHQAIKHDQSFGGACHNVMHHIGHVALKEYGSFEAAYREGNYDCGNGYFHGVVEEVFKDRGDDALSPDRLGNFCDSVKSEATTTKDYALLNCVHGLGHALAYNHGGELQKALPVCLSLKADSERTECIAGAFMENMIERLSLAAQSDPVQNPSLTCSSVAGDLYRCWAALSGFVLSVGYGDSQTALQFCRGFGSQVYREACGEGIGKAVRIGRESDTRGISGYCLSHAEELSTFCSRGAIVHYNDVESPFYSQTFGMLAWPMASGTDLLIGKVEKMQ